MCLIEFCNFINLLLPPVVVSAIPNNVFSNLSGNSTRIPFPICFSISLDFFLEMNGRRNLSTSWSISKMTWGRIKHSQEKVCSSLVSIRSRVLRWQESYTCTYVTTRIGVTSRNVAFWTCNLQVNNTAFYRSNTLTRARHTFSRSDGNSWYRSIQLTSPLTVLPYNISIVFPKSGFKSKRRKGRRIAVIDQLLKNS